MELTHNVLVLLIVGYTTASPYGYGTKGGAVAKANANAAAGAFVGVGDIPISVPSNTGFSGSFSKSSSSSSSSSSASSSSSSYSYSGSGSYGANGCGSGSCHGSQGSTGAGSQAYGAAGANSLSSVGGVGGKIPTSSYAHKYNHGSQTQDNDCGSDGCQGSKDSNIKGSEITIDAKATAASNVGLSTGSNCGGSDCNSLSSEKCSSGDCYSNGNTNSDKSINNCVSGDCGTDSQKSVPSQDGGELCTSGQCGSNKDTESGSSIDHIDIHVPVSVADSKSNYDGKPSNTISEPGCSSGNCGPSELTETKPYQNPSTGSGSLSIPGYTKPATHLTTPKLEPPCTTPNCQKAPNNNSPVENDSKENNPCVGGICGPTGTPYTSTDTMKVNLGQIPSSYSGPSNVKPDNYCGSSPSNTPVISSGAACSPGTPGCVTPVTGSSSSTLSYGVFTNIKPSYSQGTSASYSPLQPSSSSCAPGNPSCFLRPTNTQPDCTTGLCAVLPSSPISGGSLKPGYSQGTYSPIEITGQNCAPGSSGCALTPISASSECASGNCDASSSAPGYGGSAVIKPSGPGCSPGTPGCSSAYPSSGSFTIKPSNSYGIVSSNPLVTPCSPGSPGCALAPTVCESGICGGVPSTPVASNKNPSYNDGIYTPINPSIPECPPGTSGCGASHPSDVSLNMKPFHPYGIESPVIPCSPGSPGCATAPSGCTSGNCGPYPATPAVLNKKPIYTDEVSTSFSPVNPSILGCLPGTPGCGSTHISSGSFTIKPSNSYDIKFSNLPVTPCSPGSPGCASAPQFPSRPISLNNKPSYSHGYSSSYTPVNPSMCAPGTPGCSGPLSCASGNCGSSSSAVHGGSLNIKPGYSAGISPSLSPLIPSGPACSPGSPGCVSPQSTPSYSGSYATKPSYSHGASPSYVSLPSITSCDPGTPGCGTTLPIPFTHPDNLNLNKPTYPNPKPSGPNCAPGTPGCSIPTNINSPSGCSSGKCGSAGYGGSITFKPSYSQSNSLSCTPGAPGCSTPTDLGLSSCAPGSPGCIASSPTSPSASGYGASSIGTSPTQGAFGSHSTSSIQASFNKPNTGLHISSSGSYTPGSASGISTAPSLASGTLPAPGIGSSPSKPSSSGINNIGVASGASVQGVIKDEVPYNGGFGGPTGILKPNESNYTPYKPSSSIPTPSTGTTTSTTLPAACSSGDCQHGHTTPSLNLSGSNSGTIITAATSPSLSHAGSYGGTTISAATSPSLSHVGSNSGTITPAASSPSLSHAGSNSGTIISAGASASADAVAYTGGFGGPPGLLSPYDNGKIDLKSPSGKQLLDSSLDSNKGPGGNGHSTYSNGGAQVGGNAVAQANAATFSSAGSHGTGGCGGGCGGSSDYNSSFGHSKTDVFDDTSIAGADASAGAVAKSVANASSNTKGYGGSYASSSASAHASAGASVKGGYGRR